MRIALAVLGAFLTFSAATADDHCPEWEAVLGKRPPMIVATPATGPMAKAVPFDPTTYGKSSGTFPAGRADRTCVMIYTTKLDERCLALIRKLDAVARDKKMEGSFVHVFDAKGAQAGGYTADAVVSRIKELTVVAEANKLTHVSLGITASPDAAKVGLTGKNNVAVALLKKDEGLSKAARVEWYRVLATDKLESETLATLLAELPAK